MVNPKMYHRLTPAAVIPLPHNSLKVRRLAESLAALPSSSVELIGYD
jgi:hypothetical protein